MAEVSAATDVFSLDSDGRALIFLTARRRYDLGVDRAAQIAAEITTILQRWSDSGWRTSVAAMFGDDDVPTIYETGFAHDFDFGAAFEAPSLDGAYAGVAELESIGWNELFETQWIIGPREFQPVPNPIVRVPDAGWVLFALWEWNDGWQAATEQERTEYDLECDVAFASDVQSGVSIAGRHRMDAQSPWHHLGIWEAPTFDHVTKGMVMHEKVADFSFTTSRHYIGRRRAALDYFGGIR
jgi:hypothetical protein